jgi:catechol 2,3-dioxygenase-like lactoylglutathione lyase family enzyme
MIKVRSLNHAALNVIDFEKSKDFYENVLGFRKLPRPDFGVPGAWYGIGKNQVHLIEKQPGDDRYTLPGGFDPTDKHVALVVENLEETKKSLDERGIPYGATELTVPPGILLKLIVVKDPDGNVFEIRESYPMPKEG